MTSRPSLPSGRIALVGIADGVLPLKHLATCGFVSIKAVNVKGGQFQHAQRLEAVIGISNRYHENLPAGESRVCRFRLAGPGPMPRTQRSARVRTADNRCLLTVVCSIRRSGEPFCLCVDSTTWQRVETRFSRALAGWHWPCAQRNGDIRAILPELLTTMTGPAMPR